MSSLRSTPSSASGSGVTILIATRNRHKVRELRRLLRGIPVRLLTLERFPDIPSAREDGATFRANAVKKAVAASRHIPLPVLAEDSGLAVRALGGAPGVRSARFAGPRQDDRANVEKLLSVLRRVPPSRRQGRFVCVMALAIGGRLIRTFEGRCAGAISLAPAGRTGFGYDPVFIPRGLKKTFAELGDRVKDRLSHRTRAVRGFSAWLKRYLSEGPAGRAGSPPRFR